MNRPNVYEVEECFSCPFRNGRENCGFDCLLTPRHTFEPHGIEGGYPKECPLIKSSATFVLKNHVDKFAFIRIKFNKYKFMLENMILRLKKKLLFSFAEHILKWENKEKK